MLRFALRRLGTAVIVLLGASVFVFVLIRMVPGDPALFRAGSEATPEQIAAIREQMGLDQPIFVQYLIWLRDAVRLDFGISTLANTPVLDVVTQRFGATIELALAGIVVALMLGLTLGGYSGLRPRSPLSGAIGAFNAIFRAVPSFWLGILAISIFGLTLGVLPVGGRPSPGAPIGEHLRYLVLPAIVLGLVEAPLISRFLRAGLLEVSSEDYIRTARAKGLPSSRVILRHQLPNALGPVVTVSGLVLGGLLGGVAVIETVFNWPGLGSGLLQAVQRRDYAMIQAIMLLAVACYSGVNLVVDVLYASIDPRARGGRSS